MLSQTCLGLICQNAAIQIYARYHHGGLLLLKK